ncbi:glycosyl hydrolase family 8 [Azospirillum doebereinerae]|uniref:glycosyl hydrolase family 8 n=1 Tax=Azospirillum doebereinerae TaxID=92933 RepID=UPI001EE5556B|nr:glycosyl hydrolase family 8 [Azospirillum doebereinerae]MCG5240244.1 glycosyl hydrolase family 8 [Azospirillum doebereinerae]
MTAPSRREVLIGAAIAGLLVAAAPAWAKPFDGAAWRDYAQRFLLPEGRIVDSGNKGVSHSEGQGYGMLLAEAADDRAAFDRLWGWTQRNLMVREDGLAAWRWQPEGGVTDRNNASDGDILIAWALLRGAERWKAEAYRTAAAAILKALAAAVVVEQAGMTVLLPGRDGFRKGDSLVLNPSYWVFPALRAFAAQPGGAVWGKIADSGLVLLSKARFGGFQLPPDWLSLDPQGNATVAEGFRKQYGYDAVRVPLYLAWDGYRDPYYFRPFAMLAARYAGTAIPATVSLPGGTTTQVAASVGMLAVYRLACLIAGTGNAVTVPPFGPNEDYYSTTLAHMAALAAQSLGFEP